MPNQEPVAGNAGRFSAIRSIEEDGEDDVYCISVPDSGNFVANGIVVKNCDALRYACYSAFPNAEFNHPDENLSIDQLRRKAYEENEGYGFMNPMMAGGYF